MKAFSLNMGLGESEGKIYYMEISGMDFWMLSIGPSTRGSGLMSWGGLQRGVDPSSWWYFALFFVSVLGMPTASFRKSVT